MVKVPFISVFMVAVGASIAIAAPVAFDSAVPLGLVPPKIPKNNQLTEAKAKLGEKLFYDGRLSMNGLMSCSSCHMPEHGFADFLPLGFTAIGGPLQRNTPTIVNAAMSDYQFWDGRSASLEEQIDAVYHLTADASIDTRAIVKKLNAMPEYVSEFKKAFNSRPSIDTFCKAIASYERTALSGNTRFDRFFFQDDRNALSEVEKQGFDIFIGKGNCTSCHLISKDRHDKHASALFIDQQFHNLGIGAFSAKRMKDGGRYLVTGDPKDLGKFKTPGLRNVELTDPYMHDGSLSTLDEVVEFYDRGGNANPNLDPQIKPLHLSKEEKTALTAFLKTLTDEKLAKLYVPVPELQRRARESLDKE